MRIIEELAVLLALFAVVVIVGGLSFTDETMPAERAPVIIVPGILGSELYEGEELVWPDLQKLYDESEDGHLLKLQMSADGRTSIYKIAAGNLVVSVDYNQIQFRFPDSLIIMFSNMLGNGLPVVHIYDSLIDELKVQGYEEGKDLFLFPYDWRRDIRETAPLLREKIGEAAQQGQVVIIAHSMGGVVARYALADESIAGKVKLLVLVGVPNAGSMDAFFAVEEGINEEFVNKKTTRRLAQNFPSLYQLMPVPLPEGSGNTILAKDAEKFAAELDSKDLGIKVVQIIGTGIPTAGTDGNEDGDGTVTTGSALLLGDEKAEGLFIREKHRTLLANRDVIKFILEELEEITVAENTS